MILLDTNVVSEVMKTRPAETVVAWLNGQDSEKLYVSAISIGEIAYGLRILPDGKRRSGLRERFERFVALAFDQRTLAYDESAARIYGELMGDRKELGLPMSVPQMRVLTIWRWRPGMSSTLKTAASKLSIPSRLRSEARIDPVLGGLPTTAQNWARGKRHPNGRTAYR